MPRNNIPLEKIPAVRAPSVFQPVVPVDSARKAGLKGPSAIMYLERKAGKLIGDAQIGRVTFSKTKQTIYYRGRAFKRLPGGGFKSNYYDQETGEEYWISGPRKDGRDRLYGERLPIAIDDDVREEYWCLIRNEPGQKHRKTA